VVEWFWRRRPRIPAPRLRSKEDAPPPARVDLHEFTPEPPEFFARAAYVELVLFERLARAGTSTPTTAIRSALARAADAPLSRHRAFVTEIERMGADPGEAMDRRRAAVDRFQRLTVGADWLEDTATAHFAGGFLDDLFRSLATGLPVELQARTREILARRSEDGVCAVLLREAMERDERLQSRLALWGRRILGDAMLVARDALELGEDRSGAEQRIEPAFSELIADHTRRMDALGLSA